MNILFIGNHNGKVKSTEDIIREINPSHFKVTLNDGEEAIKFIAELKRVKITSFFDLIFLDLELPNVDGMTILKYLQRDEVLRTIPIVAVSEDPVEMGRCFEIGAIACIDKQSDIAKNEKIIRRVIGIVERKLKEV